MCLSVKYLDQYVLEVNVNEWKTGGGGNRKEEVISVNILGQIIHLTLLSLLVPARLSTPPPSLTQRFGEY